MDSNETNQRNDTNGRASGGYGRRMRASDADRAATADRLRQHYTEGRLDAQEYDERIDRCYAAKTVDELDDLFVDLPRPAPRSPEPEAERHQRGHYPPPWRVAAIVAVVAALIAACALTGAHLFWLAWPLFFIFFFGPFGRWRRAGCGRQRDTGTPSA